MRLATGIAALSLLFAASAPAHAVQVRECDETASLQSLAEPWEKHIRSFYEGNVRVAMLDTGGEPVCCSVHLLIMIPDKSDEMGGRLCRLVGSQDSLGFNGIDFARLQARYDASRGLLLTFPYILYVDGIKSKSGVARIRVNTASGQVSVER